MMVRQALIMANLKMHKAASCCLPKLDRNGYDWLFSRAWERADQIVKDRFNELRSNVKKLPKPSSPFVFDQNSQHTREPDAATFSAACHNSFVTDEMETSAIIENYRPSPKTRLEKLSGNNSSFPQVSSPLTELVEI